MFDLTESTVSSRKNYEMNKRLTMYIKKKGRSIIVEKAQYIIGVAWMVIGCFFSSTNDSIMRVLGSSMVSSEIVFFRYVFSSITLLPFVLCFSNYNAQEGKISLLNFFMILVGFASMSIWCRSIINIPLSITSIFSLVIPLLTAPLAYVILKEKLSLQGSVSTLIGIMTVLVVLLNQNRIEDVSFGNTNLNVKSLALLILASFLFSMQDIVNKKIAEKGCLLNSLLYYSIGVAMLSMIQSDALWKLPNTLQWVLLFFLGGSNNLVIYCFFKASLQTMLSSLTAFRYIEFLFSAAYGYFMFSEHPTMISYIALFILFQGVFLTGCIRYCQIFLSKRRQL